MTKRKWMIVAITVVTLAILAGIPLTMQRLQAQEATHVTDEHAGHDHSADVGADVHAEPEPSADVEADAHAGHDHSAGVEADVHAGSESNADMEADAHAGHDHSADDEGIKLTKAQLLQMEVATAIAGPDVLGVQVTLPGEIRLNEDRVAHIVPRISGVVKEVWAHLGDKVHAGQILALIESRELAIAKAEYLAALQRLTLADGIFEREERLFESKVSAEADYLLARQQKAERDIEVSLALQKLLALGLSHDQVVELPEESLSDLRIYALTAPYDGTIIEKHLVQGEVVSDQVSVYLLADLDTVWIDLNAYQKDTPVLRKGQPVNIAGDGLVSAEAKITYVSPVLREDVRTLLVRAVLPNPNNRYRPGLFVSGKVTVDGRDADIVVPAEAVLNVDGKESVFVQENGGFIPVPVMVGRSNGRSVEILSGLKSGQRYVTQGSFALKAVKVTSSFEGHAGHGH